MVAKVANSSGLFARKALVACVMMLAILAAVGMASCAAPGSASSARSSAASGSAAASASSASASTSASASASASVQGPVRVMALNGPTGIGMAALSEDPAYDVRFVGATDEVVSAVASGSVDIAAVPTNLASVLYNKTQGGVKLIAVDTYGTLYILENGQSVESIADLAGKKVYATGQGANPQFILEYVLDQASLAVGEDVQVEYLAEHAELAALLAKGEAEIGLLPEPFVSVAQSKNPDVRVALDLNEQWEQATGGKLAMGCVVVRTEWAADHPDQVAQFLDDLSTSIAHANTDVPGTAALCAELGILPNAEVAEAAIPKCSLVCVTGAEAKMAVAGYLDVLAQANPKSVGGAVPDDAFYYEG